MLDELLGSKTRAVILSVLLDAPRESVHLRELVRKSGGSISSVQRELARLENLGIAASAIDGSGRRQVSLVTEHPFADPLAGLVAAEARGTYAVPRSSRSDASSAELLNPRVRGLAEEISQLGREFGAIRIALFGSATQADTSIVPRDLDVTVRFDPNDSRSRADLYFGLQQALERISDMSVDLVEIDAVENPYMLRELDESEVVLYETP